MTRPVPSALAARALAVRASACSGPALGSAGAVLGVDNESGAVHVRETREGAAADKAGLRPGDEIVMIDGVYVRDLGAKELRERLRGDVGSSVDLTVVRGAEVRRVRLTRTELREHQEVRPREEKLSE